MAQSAPRVARLAAAVVGRSDCVLTRRSYSAAAVASAPAKRMEDAVGSGKNSKTGGAAESSSAASSWIPDPVTGYYRPANRTAELDAAELRQRLLPRRFHQ